MDSFTEFAQLAANCLAELAAPDAAPGDADEALAALEHHVYSLHGEQRYAGQAVARALWALAGTRVQTGGRRVAA
jgi:hypothetical protein